MSRYLAAAIAAAFLLTSNADAELVSLASTMDAGGYFAEDAALDSIARINFGDGTANDRDGANQYSDPNDGSFDPNKPESDYTPFGTSNLNIFPNETNFNVGQVGFDETGLSPTFTGTVQINSLDLGAFYTLNDATSDINGVDFPLLFPFGGGLTLGTFDANDTLTFTNGLLTSIDVEVEADVFVADFTGQVTYDGLLTFSGSNINLNIMETETVVGFTGPFNSTLDFQLSGIVGAVNNFQISAVPEPGSFGLAATAFGLIALRRRNRKS
ncbi:MAG: PEP-CTERM sorting domain-containing protein [Planctomycetota bacterium]